jgi:hypothetical protein
MHFNPYSNELRYTLDLMVYALQAAEPRSLRIASGAEETVKAVVRRLGVPQIPVVVQTPQLRAKVRDSLGVHMGVFDSSAEPADAALFPFSLDEQLRPVGERFVVVACENALSYKPLLYPGQVRGTVFRQMELLRPGYDVEPVGGLYAPGFIALWSLAALARRLDSAWYFRLQDCAMRRLIDRGPLWRVSYLVVFAGRAAG